MKYTIEISAYAGYNGCEYDHEPTAEELDEFIDLFIDGLSNGYLDVDINCYEKRKRIKKPLLFFYQLVKILTAPVS